MGIKKFSVLGDSISTLEGYNPAGYSVFYTGDNCVKSGVYNMTDTWWGKVIDYYDGELLVNNSWSGSRVTRLPGQENLFPSGCSDERTSQLHRGNIMPDVIIVNLGVNDWASGVETGEYAHIADYQYDIYSEFSSAYDSMLKKLRLNYPQSEIWCCTLNKSFIAGFPDFKFPELIAGNSIRDFNEIIYAKAQINHCKVNDLSDCNILYDSIDGVHPTERGMKVIADAVIKMAGWWNYYGAIGQTNQCDRDN